MRLRVISISPSSLIFRMLTLALSSRSASEQRAVDLVAVRRALHVDQVEDDQAADVAEAQLVDDLAHGLEVRLQDRVLEVAPLAAGVAAGVHVDRGQRLGLIEDQVAARLEPDLAAEALLDLVLDAAGVEERLRVAVVVDARPRRRP